jgi:hypothetical protein
MVDGIVRFDPRSDIYIDQNGKIMNRLVINASDTFLPYDESGK